MSDTTKALQDKIKKMEKEYEAGKVFAKKIRAVLDAKIMEFADAGFKDHLVKGNPAAEKMLAEKTKLQHAYDEKYAEVTGLKTKIEKATAALADYVQKKSDLKQEKHDGTIDKDEYARRKKLFKEMLEDVGTVNEKEIRKLNVDLDQKKQALEIATDQLKVTEENCKAAKKFVDAGLPGSAKDVSEKCEEYFGKRNLNPAEAAKALRKLEEKVKELQKEARILQTAVTVSDEKIAEAMDRYKQFQKDIERTKLSYENGGTTQEELDRVTANFKKTLAIK